MEASCGAGEHRGPEEEPGLAPDPGASPPPAAEAQRTARAVGTEPQWEQQVILLLEQSRELAAQHDLLMTRREGDGRHAQVLQLQEQKLEAVRQHQALLEKLESVRIKLQLNNSKSTRKNFLSKKQELHSEKCQVEEARNRLVSELDESSRKLEQLTEEQQEEQRRWQVELLHLREEAQQRRKEAQEAELQALKDEIVAVEKKRDAAVACMESWLKELRDYLNNLRADFPRQYQQEKLTWEAKEELVRQHMGALQQRYRQVLQQLQDGRELDSLPRINMPELPQVPTADLIFNQLSHSAQPRPPQGHPAYPPPPPNAGAGPSHVPSPPPSSAAGTLEKILERLAGHRPASSRAQLTALLQLVKSSRGTLAGLSVDEVVEQCLRLAPKDPGRPAAAAAPGPIQRPLSVDRHQGAAARKLCLMCQNFVDPESRHPLSCTHTVHRDCIRTWLQSSPNNPCPFCSAK